MRDRKTQMLIDKLRKDYTDFLDMCEPKECPGLYREIAAILGIAITKLTKLNQ